MKIIIFTALVLSAILGFIARPTYEKEKTNIVLRIQDSESSRPRGDDIIKATPTPKPKTKIAIILPSQEEVAKKVKGIFTEDPETAVAVFRAESGLRADAMGWNCHYYNEAGQRYSAACNPQDRAKAWSVDCGVAQINTPGNICPAHLFDVETNLAEAYKKYIRRGWQPWVAHNLGRHLVFLQ